jgi:1-phosphofructokinase family hexose kinase
MNNHQSIATVTLNPAIDQSVAVPDFSAGTVNRVLWEQSDPGGKGVNVASFLADLGFTVAVTGLLGRDNASVFEDLFAAKGIDDSFVRVAGKTRVNVKIIDEARQVNTDINFPGPAATLEILAELERRIGALLADHDCFVLSGSAPAGVPADYYAVLIRLLKSAGKRVLLDSSGEPLRHGIVAAPWAIKPNIAELEELVGTPLPDQAAVIAAARQLLAAGLGCVVVSMGGEGALFVTAEECWLAIPPAVEVKSTVGAGDAMVAGFVAATMRGLPLADCARHATASALGALTQLGPRLASAQIVESFVAQVTLVDLGHQVAGAALANNN